MNNTRFLALICAASLPVGAQALDLAPRGAFLEGGIAEHGAYSATVGVSWPWAWRGAMFGGELTAATEAFASHWSCRCTGAPVTFTQVGLVPLLRYRFSAGRSDWFMEAGIGISLTDRTYRTDEKQFSTRFNFVDVAGVGRSFGAQRRQEISLRIAHISNASIKKPNPGENFLQLRYAALF
ncbi:MAG: acyloxyacyl hydrolase [Ramlibacter sp.]|nr:acyloxyacyl hydrolase [Ramlibacter sp.]